MKSYIKDELKTIEDALKLAQKHNIENIENLLEEIKKIFENDESNEDELNAIYEKMPLIYCVLYCDLKNNQI